MASYSSPPLKLAMLLMTLLLLQQTFISMEASRLSSVIFSPLTPRPVRPPPIAGWFSMNRHKMIETTAFRPTTPGRSPGVGHNEPPGAP
ncbi:hypothetical protein Nepgr_031826 [Nepenthes gracilis]|uniref:Uncharacterized protein n=1 Tax=Nepenthes gracilis TaxID=150966 RepID=A0AAD3Y5H5_NEPGR|nr:hypothetical protein Nepgr_031826 [Nepenthes gracilis]